jgi:uncharacterized protein (DUF2384 family)
MTQTKRKSGRPLDSQKHTTLTATKPWVAEGMSRRTWYRRRKAEALPTTKSNRGRPLKGAEPRPKPWIALGMSESTWRRRQKGPRRTANHWRRAPA